MTSRALALLSLGALTAGCGSRPVEDYPPPASPVGAPTPAQEAPPRAEVGRDGRTVTVDRRARQLVLRGADGREIERRAAGTGPTNVAADERGLAYVIDTEGEGLLLFQTEPHLALRRRMALRGGPYAVALDRERNRLWVTMTATHEVVEVRAGSLPGILRRFDTVRTPVAVEVDEEIPRVSVRGAGGDVRRFTPPMDD